MDGVATFPWLPTHVAGTLLVKTGAGSLHSIVVNGLTTAGDATVYDGISNAGVVLAILHIDPTTSISVQPITFLYDMEILTGIYIEYDQALVADLTITHH